MNKLFVFAAALLIAFSLAWAEDDSAVKGDGGSNGGSGYLGGPVNWVSVSGSSGSGSSADTVPPAPDKKPTTNLPPVITSISGPSVLSVGQKGTWTINAYDPESGPLTYSVAWGDEPATSQPAPKAPSATLTHIYYSAGKYRPAFTVTDDHGETATASVTVLVSSTSSPVVMPEYLPNGSAGVQYSAMLWTNLDTAEWSVSAGNLPPGLALQPDASTALLTGVPTAAGSYMFTITAGKLPDELTANRTYSVEIAGAGSSPFHCAISPSSLTVQTNTNNALQVSCFDDRRASPGLSEIPCPRMFWAATKGAIVSVDKTQMVYFLSGASEGKGTVSVTDVNPLSMRASIPTFSCAIPVSVTTPSGPSGNGGTGGTGGTGGSGGTGGAVRTSTQVSAACAGQPSNIKVNYYATNAPAAQVVIYHLANGKYNKVFSQTVTGTSTLSFVAPSAGDYELHVSLGTDQSTASFSVPSCTPQTINTTQNITVNLAPTRELVLSKTVKYEGGFAKEFKVYRASSGTEVSYSTEIALTYTNGGNSTMQNLTIADSVPRSVVSTTGQIIFDNYPSELGTGADPQFSWEVKSLPTGGRAQFSYRFSRAITEAMIDKFAPPRVLAPGQTITGTIASGTAAGGDLLAANISFAGVSLPLSLLAVGILALVLVALILLFVFGGKKEEGQ